MIACIGAASCGEERRQTPSRYLFPPIDMVNIMMQPMLVSSWPKWFDFPDSLVKEGALSLELRDGVPMLRASKSVQTRIDALLRKQQDQSLSDAENKEFDSYEAIDDYISLLNRITRIDADWPRDD